MFKLLKMRDLKLKKIIKSESSQIYAYWNEIGYLNKKHVQEPFL